MQASFDHNMLLLGAGTAPNVVLMEPPAPWYADALKFCADSIYPLGGAIVAVLVGKDYSAARIATGVFVGIFMAWCFTDIAMFYLIKQFEVAPELYTKVHSAMGAMIGMTGLALASRIIELALTGNPPMPFKPKEGDKQ